MDRRSVMVDLLECYSNTVLEIERQTGQRLGVTLAAPFEVFPPGWGE